MSLDDRNGASRRRAEPSANNDARGYSRESERWRAVERRERAADGCFRYAVMTTGIYCRPSCPARRPLRRNVEFFADAPAAERAGYRACRRCRPQAAVSGDARGWVLELCRFIEAAAEPPSLAELASRAGRSRCYVQRAFKRAVGVSPRAYALAHRAQRLKHELAQRSSIAAAGYGAGYGSSGRLYAAADHELGMTPSAYRAGGSEQDIIYGTSECALGSVLLARTARGVCAIILGDSRADVVAELQARFPRARAIEHAPALEELLRRVCACVEAPGASEGLEDLPLDVRGAAFQRRVWDALREIPPGTTQSYTELARRLGLATGARAVAAACAANPVALAIPCHRVVRSDGELAGYRWGIERKRWLLESEEKRAAASGALERRTGITRARDRKRRAKRG